MDAPYPYWKMQSSHLGGIATGMVISWPKGIASRSEIRSQFANITDIAPTIYEAARIVPPTVVDGVTQMPLAGRSMAGTFASNDAPAPRRQQYFETIGTMSIYKDGWLASLRLARGETLRPDMAANESWALYNLKVDPTQTIDVAAENPKVVADLKAAFREDAIRNKAFPISAVHAPAPAPHFRQAGVFDYYPSDRRYGDDGFPSIRRRSWRVVASVDTSRGGEGAIVTQGGYFAGWGLLLVKAVPTFIYKYSDDETSTLRLSAGRALAPGRHRLEVKSVYDSGASGKGGSFSLLIDGVAVAEGRLPRLALNIFANEGASVGHDTGTSLTDDYRPPFRFTGQIEKVTIETGPLPSAPSGGAAATPSKAGRQK